MFELKIADGVLAETKAVLTFIRLHHKAVFREREKVSALILNMSFRQVPVSMTCDITTYLEANHGPVSNFTRVLWLFQKDRIMCNVMIFFAEKLHQTQISS